MKNKDKNSSRIGYQEWYCCLTGKLSEKRYYL